MEKKIKPKKVSEDTPKEEIVSKPGFRKYSQKIKTLYLHYLKMYKHGNNVCERFKTLNNAID